MHVIRVDDVNEALAVGLAYLRDMGERKSSRNGDVLKSALPVTTVYRNPLRRVLLSPQRDANPFFHLFEALWILKGRNDVGFLKQFNGKMADYSDDGETFHAPYGWRLRCEKQVDQIETAIDLLRKNHDERRAVLQIWDADLDLGVQSKDLPCNDMIFLNINSEVGGPVLDMMVANRSNDIIWGAYGANAVQFSVLQEFIAARLGVAVGTYHQVSFNYHLYENLPFYNQWRHTYPSGVHAPDMYEFYNVKETPLFDEVEDLNDDLHYMFKAFDNENGYPTPDGQPISYKWIDHLRLGSLKTQIARTVLLPMLQSFAMYKLGDPLNAINILNTMAEDSDWRAAGLIWLQNRIDAKKAAGQPVTTAEPRVVSASSSGGRFHSLSLDEPK